MCRGRKLTADEALEIFKECEKAGMVHQFGDSEDPEVICNCCPDCYLGFGKLLPQLPEQPGLFIITNYFSQIDMEKCVAHRKCEAFCTAKSISIERSESVSDKRYVAPCEEACPAGINVPGYVALIQREV
jgi:hypothetical protein